MEKEKTNNKAPNYEIDYRVYPHQFFSVAGTWGVGVGCNLNSKRCGSVLNLYIKRNTCILGSLYCKGNI